MTTSERSMNTEFRPPSLHRDPRTAVEVAQNRAEEEAHPIRHGLATFGAFVIAGAVPLLPFLTPELTFGRFVASCAVTLAILFGVGAARAAVTIDRWWWSGLEMLLLGVAVAAVAYGSGALVADWLQEPV